METTLPTETQALLGHPTERLSTHVAQPAAYPPVRQVTSPAAKQSEVVPTPARNFRALSHEIFRRPSVRDYLFEVTVVASILIAAAWPLGYFVHQLMTMMIRYR